MEIFTMSMYIPVEHTAPWSPYYEITILLSLMILIGTLCLQYARENDISKLHSGLTVPCAILAIFAFLSPLWAPFTALGFGIIMMTSNGVMGVMAGLIAMGVMILAVSLHVRLTFPVIWEQKS